MNDARQHNYMQKLLQLWAQGKLPRSGLSDVMIFHDDWCGIYRGRLCNCQPIIEVRPLAVLDPRRN